MDTRSGLRRSHPHPGCHQRRERKKGESQQLRGVPRARTRQWLGCDDAYLADAEAWELLTRWQIAKRPSAIAADRGRIEGQIKSLLGAMPLATNTPRTFRNILGSSPVRFRNIR